MPSDIYVSHIYICISRLYLHSENYVAIKNNKKDLSELIWSNFQDILLYEKSKAQENIYIIFI